ncbi:MAG: AMP-binding protein [Bacteroidales bacterium]|jgi:phenylacetate-CoA ligase|nr:AMP-binding protein [Bacteroidales bacterium]
MEQDSGIQFLSAEEIKSYQEKRLAGDLEYLENHSAFYKRLFKENVLDIRKIRKLEDLRCIPPTTKNDLQLHNEDFRCVPDDDIIDYVTTSGTLGDPVTFTETENDLQHLAYNEYLSFKTAGCCKHDIMQLMTTIDRRFMAGLAYFLGARKMGMGIARVGNGIPELQWDTINRIHPTVGMAVPSFLMKLISFAKEHGIDYHGCSLRKCICIGEALRDPQTFEFNTLGNRIHEEWPELSLYSTYASTEMQHSYTDCEYFNGGHVQPELIIAEFLDDEGNPVASDEPGEVTITTLGVTGMPLLRFRTGDVVYHFDEPCRCGRNTTRLGSVLGRKGQMIKFKGTTLYPPALFDILDNIPGVVNYVVEVSTNDLGTDDVKVRIGTDKPGESFEKEIKDLFRARVRVAPSVVFESVEAINKLMFPAMSRKPVKFFDYR